MARASEAPYASIGQASADPTIAPHLALLLPTGSEIFSRAAEAVRAGFLEAAKKQPKPALAVRLYAVTDDPQHVIAAYKLALAAGARIVVGPLTRNGVAAFAGAGALITVPTLALNAPERVAVNPPNLYSMSLQVEGEARQVAQLALRDGRLRALTITDQTVLGKRMREAFAEEFQRGGGYQIADYVYAGDSGSLERIKQASASGAADMVFLAVDAQRARAVRPFLLTLSAYGTSQLNPGQRLASAFVELDGVRFVDMPWMLQPDHPAVMVYARPDPRQSDDLERLYALGIDAYRVAQEVLAGKRDIEVDGVTGRLTLESGGQFRRSLPVALISGGKVTVQGEGRP